MTTFLRHVAEAAIIVGFTLAIAAVVASGAEGLSGLVAAAALGAV